MTNSRSSSSPSQRSRGDDRSHKGRDHRPETSSRVRPATGPATGASQTGSNPGFVEEHAPVVDVDQPQRLQATGQRRHGFTEEQTKDIGLSSGGGLSQSDPDHSLRGEDQLIDGDAGVMVEEEE